MLKRIQYCLDPFAPCIKDYEALIQQLGNKELQKQFCEKFETAKLCLPLVDASNPEAIAFAFDQFDCSLVFLENAVTCKFENVVSRTAQMQIQVLVHFMLQENTSPRVVSMSEAMCAHLLRSSISVVDNAREFSSALDQYLNHLKMQRTDMKSTSEFLRRILE